MIIDWEVEYTAEKDPQKYGGWIDMEDIKAEKGDKIILFHIPEDAKNVEAKSNQAEIFVNKQDVYIVV